MASLPLHSSQQPGRLSSTARDFLTRPPTGKYFSPALPSDCFAIDFPRRAMSLGEGLLFPSQRHYAFSPKGVAGLSFTARIGRSSSFSMILPSSLVFPHQEWHPCWSHCGGRARLQIIPPSSLVLSSGMGADRSSTARVQRGPSEAARCASTEDHQAPSLPLLREQGISTGVMPPLSPCAFCEQEGWSGGSLSHPSEAARCASKETTGWLHLTFTRAEARPVAVGRESGRCLQSPRSASVTS